MVIIAFRVKIITKDQKSQTPRNRESKLSLSSWKERIHTTDRGSCPSRGSRCISCTGETDREVSICGDERKEARIAPRLLIVNNT